MCISLISFLTHIILLYLRDAIAKWICLCLRSSCPGFESHLSSVLIWVIVKFVLYLSFHCEKNENKQKRGRGWSKTNVRMRWNVQKVDDANDAAGRSWNLNQLSPPLQANKNIQLRPILCWPNPLTVKLASNHSNCLSPISATRLGYFGQKTSPKYLATFWATLKNVTLWVKSNLSTFWATFGKYWASLNLNIMSHWAWGT